MHYLSSTSKKRKNNNCISHLPWGKVRRNLFVGINFNSFAGYSFFSNLSRQASIIFAFSNWEVHIPVNCIYTAIMNNLQVTPTTKDRNSVSWVTMIQISSITQLLAGQNIHSIARSLEDLLAPPANRLRYIAF